MLIHIFVIMKIEQSIKQSRFDSLEEKLVVNIMYTSNRLHFLISKMFKPYGLSPEQFNVLRILRGQNGNPISLLSIEDRMLDKSSNVSRLIDKLLIKQYITRSISKSDRRKVDVRISQIGLDVLKKIDVDLALFFKKINTLISHSDANQMNDLLDNFRTIETLIQNEKK